MLCESHSFFACEQSQKEFLCCNSATTWWTVLFLNWCAHFLFPQSTLQTWWWSWWPEVCFFSSDDSGWVNIQLSIRSHCKKEWQKCKCFSVGWMKADCGQKTKTKNQWRDLFPPKKGNQSQLIGNEWRVNWEWHWSWECELRQGVTWNPSLRVWSSRSGGTQTRALRKLSFAIKSSFKTVSSNPEQHSLSHFLWFTSAWVLTKNPLQPSGGTACGGQSIEIHQKWHISFVKASLSLLSDDHPLEQQWWVVPCQCNSCKAWSHRWKFLPHSLSPSAWSLWACHTVCEPTKVTLNGTSQLPVKELEVTLVSIKFVVSTRAWCEEVITAWVSILVTGLTQHSFPRSKVTNSG